jgi:uncharacterized protein YqgC (DUF456 family)
MGTLGIVLFSLFLFLGVASIVFGFPGTLIVFFSALLYGLFSGFEKITGGMILGLGLLTLCGEALEYVFGVIGARRFGASKKGVVCSIVGGFIGAVLGAPFLLGIGAVLGAFVGAFVGATAVELAVRGPGAWREALRSGLGSFLGRIAGMIAKVALASGMAVWILSRLL